VHTMECRAVASIAVSWPELTETEGGPGHWAEMSATACQLLWDVLRAFLSVVVIALLNV
jgi:hypothetical protein